MGFFSGITDFVGDVVGGIADTVSDVLEPASSLIGPLAGMFPGGSLISEILGGYSLVDSVAKAAGDDWDGSGALPISIFGAGSSGLADMAASAARSGLSANSNSIWSALAPFGASLLQGGLGYIGQSSANAANEQNVANQLAFQGEWNQKAMDFSERMSNTAWRRQIHDMRSAGINPMLAVMRGGSGASSPSGVTSAGAAAVAQNAMAPAVSTALGAMEMMARVENIRAQTNRTNVQAALDATLIPKTEQDTRVGHSAESVNQAQYDRLRIEVQRLFKEIDYIAERTNLSREETNKVKAEIPNVILSGEKIKAETRNTQANAMLNELDIPRMRNLAKAEETWFKGAVSPFLGDVGRIFGSALDARRTLR